MAYRRKSPYSFRRRSGRSMIDVYKNGKHFGSYMPSAHWFTYDNPFKGERTFRSRSTFLKFFGY